MTNTQKPTIQRRERIATLARTFLREREPSYHYLQRDTTFLYLGQVVEGDAKAEYVLGNLRFDSQDKVAHFSDNIEITQENSPVQATLYAISSLKWSPEESRLFPYVQRIDATSDGIRIVPVYDGLIDVIQELIKTQSELNSYKRRVSCLNKQVNGEKIK